MKYFTTADKIDGSMGGKACGLARLLSCGVRVPDFLVLPYNALDIFAERDIQKAVSGIKKFAFPDDFKEEIRCIFELYKFDKVAVRSSCSDEDGAEKSFAGQYKTVLDVTEDGVCDAIKEVWLSAIERDGKNSYSSKDGNGKMSVIVQRQINADIAGVCFSSSPLDANKILIEYVEGCGEKLVGGTQSPKRYEADKENKTSGFLEEVRNTALKIEEICACPSDIEWCLEGGEIFFVQLRAVTAAFDLPNMTESKWNLYVKRDFPWLVHSVQVEASKSEVQKQLFGFAVPIYEGVLVDGNEFYTQRNDELTDELWAKMTVAELKKFCNSVNENCDRIDKYTKKLAQSDCDMRKDEYYCALKEFFDEYLRSYVPMMMRPEEYLALQLRKKGVSESDIANLGYFAEDAMTVSEKQEFLKLAVERSKGKDIDMLTEDYLAHYSWMKSPVGYDLCEFTAEDVAERISQAGYAQWSDKLSEMNRSSATMRQLLEKTLEKLPTETKDIAKLLNVFIYLRTRTAELSDRLFYIGRKILLSRLTDTDIGEDYVYLGYRELLEYVEDGIVPKNLSVRKHGNYTVWTNGISVTGFGLAPKELIGLTESGDSVSSRTIKGDIACPGRAVGSVRVVKDRRDAEKMQNGEILVASMTTTDLTDAISNAAGFITDEGGISCHAAIIARELNVPCIVGTRVATHMLRTGMTVELDAFNGSVMIINANED